MMQRLADPRERRDFGLWLLLLGLAAAVFALRGEAAWLQDYPKGWVVPMNEWITAAVAWFVETFKWFFRLLTMVFEWPMNAVKTVLLWLPWPVTIGLFALLGYIAAGWRLVVFTLLALFYMVAVGYWSESMSTLALVSVSIPLSVTLGFVIGVWAFRSARANRVIQPALDFMQTIPAFAYLIPILLLFGFGPVVGLIASAIYAAPPMVRNVILGLQRVPSDILESGTMSGCTPRQRFWWVEVPTAMPQILVGINQTTMAALAMVIIAAIIGGFQDIGWEVLSTMRKAQFGQSLLSGIVIALLAMIMDRISWGFAQRQSAASSGAPDRDLAQRRRKLFLGAALAIVAVGLVLPRLSSIFDAFPDDLVRGPGGFAEDINRGIEWILANFGSTLTALKNKVLFFFLLPLRIGLAKAVAPFSWGFALTDAMVIGYVVAAAALTLYLGYRSGWRAAVFAVLAGGLLYFGTTGVPWPVFIAVVTLLAWQTGGRPVALFALVSMAFMLVNGLWEQVMLSVYLCGAAVVISFLLGGALGIWAAQSDRVSGLLRPINDTLQTMPQFVLLIPVLMFFQVGEFTALLAVIAYAIVPCIRYTEHGLRNVRPDIVEAAQSMGCTRRQILFEVKLPQALPEIMLGLNQTILFGLAMLVIAALVGTTGLGQQVYIALGKADAGRGLVAGLSMALVAMIADRIIQSWSARRKAALGLA